MTIIVAGKWELGYFAPLTELTLWEFVMREYGLQNLAMTPVTGVSSTDITLREYASVQDILDAFPTYKRIFVEPVNTNLTQTELTDYTFSSGDQLFVFGNAASGNEGLITTEDEVVTMTTRNNLNLMFGFQVLNSLAYRQFKGG